MEGLNHKVVLNQISFARRGHKPVIHSLPYAQSLTYEPVSLEFGEVDVCTGLANS